MRNDFIAGLLSLALFALTAGQSEAAPIVFLDGDTPATGSLLPGTPLVTPFGTVNLSGALTVPPAEDIDMTALGSLGRKFAGNATFPVGVLSWDFDVQEISLLYGGNLGGITVEALNAANVVLDTFTQADTTDGMPAGPLTLTGLGIRSLRWFDPVATNTFAIVDNVSLNVTPEPGSLILCGIAFSCLGAGGLKRRRKKAQEAAQQEEALPHCITDVG